MTANVGKSSDPLPGWVWWSTRAGVGIVIAVTVIGAILLARGATDPPVAGPVIWADTELIWAGGPVIALAAGESIWFTAPESAPLPPGGFTLDVSAQITTDSDPGTAWGVWIETGDGERVIYAISGEGYTTTRNCVPHPLAESWTIEDCPALRPEWRWMPYPRINSPGTMNTITLHTIMPHRENALAGGSEVRLRINRENMGAAQIQWSGRWGIWLQGGRAGGASGIPATIRLKGTELRG